MFSITMACKLNICALFLLLVASSFAYDGFNGKLSIFRPCREKICF